MADKPKLKLTKAERAAFRGIMAALGRVGGSSTSEAKKKAAQENAKLGGRPEKPDSEGNALQIYNRQKKRESRLRLANKKQKPR